MIFSIITLHSYIPPEDVGNLSSGFLKKHKSSDNSTDYAFSKFKFNNLCSAQIDIFPCVTFCNVFESQEGLTGADKKDTKREA